MIKHLPRGDDTLVPCATTDPEIFHGDEAPEVAKELCADCPFAPACRADARASRVWGTWGGETTAERTAAGFPPSTWRARSPRTGKETTTPGALQRQKPSPRGQSASSSKPSQP